MSVGIKKRKDMTLINMGKTEKEIALERNPDLKAFQDEWSNWWIIRNQNDRNISDWHLFEESAWKEVNKFYSPIK